MPLKHRALWVEYMEGALVGEQSRVQGSWFRVKV